jgi:hypothetical protein
MGAPSEEMTPMKEPILIDHDAFEFIVDALCSALPFVEDCEHSTDFKRGTVRQIIAGTRNAIHLGQYFLDEIK